MATNMSGTLVEHWRETDGFRPHVMERPANGKENGVERESAPQWALAPLVDKIAYGLATGLVTAMKELESHIASETRKVSETVGRRLDTLQASVQDLTGAMAEQGTLSMAVQEQCRQLAAETASLRDADTRHSEELGTVRAQANVWSAELSEKIQGLGGELQSRQQETERRFDSLAQVAAGLHEADTRQTAELTALRAEAREVSTALTERINTLCSELGLQQEDMDAVKSTLNSASSRVDGVVERMDRQAEALRSIYSTYAQRETELEQLVDVVARLRSHPAPIAAKSL
jgi:hypothetical protein